MASKAPSAPGDWIAVGFKVLRNEGPSAFTVDRFRSEIVPGGSTFLGHFKSIGGFVVAAAGQWAEQDGEELVRAAGTGEGPLDRLWSALALTAPADPALERAIRALAADYPDVAEIVRTADDRRERILTALIAGAHRMDEDEACYYARLLAALHVGALYQPSSRIADYVGGAVRALVATLDSNFPID